MNFNINRVKIVITVPSQNVKQERNDQNENNNSMWQFKIYQRNDGNNRKNGVTRKLYVSTYI